MVSPDELVDALPAQGQGGSTPQILVYDCLGFGALFSFAFCCRYQLKGEDIVYQIKFPCLF